MHVGMSQLWHRIKASVTGHSRLGEETDQGIDSRDDEPVHSRTLSTDYTELMGGSVPCPSCKGTGRIPKEMEETLVALIPINDDRLKPKHTWRWIAGVVLLCVLIASGVIFMLVPRAVELHSSMPAITQVSANMTQEKPPILKIWFINSVNVSNANYYAVEVQNTTATVISKFQPWSKEVIGVGANSTVINVKPLSGDAMTTVGFNNSIKLDGVVAEYCTAPWSRLTPLFVTMQFDVVVTLGYFNHREQISMSLVQQVCCIPSGNCTSAN